MRTELPLRWKRGRRTIEASVRDLNADGLMLAVAEAYPVNQVMELEVELPGGPVSMVAVSRTSGASGIGVEIFAMEPTERARWHAFYRNARATAIGQLPESVAALFTPPHG